jgi:DegV family protein with EDD domain
MKHLILALALLGQYPEEKNKTRVLIVDDEPIIGNLLEAGLSEAGFEAAYFSTGTEALDSIHRIRPDIIISDIVMPYMDAYELRRRVRQDPRTSGIPFIFLSARAETSDQLEGLRTGPDDYIYKPFKMDNLIERVKSVIDRCAKHRTFQSQTELGAAPRDPDIIVQTDAENSRKSTEPVFISANDGKKPGAAFLSDRGDAKEGRDTQSCVSTDLMPAEDDRDTQSCVSTDLTPAEDDRDAQSCVSTDLTPAEESGNPLFSADTEALMHNSVSSPSPPEKASADGLSGSFRDPAADLNPGASSLPPLPAVPEENFLKMLRSFEQGGLSGMLEVRDFPPKAVLWFEDGAIVHALHGNTVGKKALYRIFSEPLNSKPPEFKVRRFTEEKTVEGSLDALLEEGRREIAKFQELRDSTFEYSVTINQEALQKTDKLAGRPGLNHILSLAGARSKVRDIIADSRMTDFQTYRHLFYLVKQGILTVGNKRRPQIQLITDSTADLPRSLADREYITVIQLSADRIRKADAASPTAGNRSPAPAFPLASAPAEEDLHELFARLIPEKDILAVFLSGKISKISQNALSAKRKNADEYQRRRQQTSAFSGSPTRADKPDCRIEIIDSRLVSAGLGLLIAEASERIEEGWEIGRIADHIRKLIPLIRIFFVADPRSRETGTDSRISKFSRFLGITPVLSLWNGELTVIDQVRGRKNAANRILEWIEQGLDNPAAPVKVGIMHADVPGWAGAVREKLKERFNCRDVLISRVSPAGGSYCGPGTVAVAYFPMPEEERIVFRSYGRPL